MCRTGFVSFRHLLVWFVVGELFCRPAGAQKDFLFEKTFPPDVPERHQIDTGMLYSGADAEDLDRGILAWDYITYLAYRFRIDDKNQIRLRHQYWRYLDNNYRHIYEFAWRRRLDTNRAIVYAADFLDEREGYRSGAGYLGYQSVLGRDLQWYLQGGLGYDGNHDWYGSVFLDTLKPLSRSTLLRLRNEFLASTSGYISDAVRINLIQALHRRVALNLGYRFFLNDEVAEGLDDMRSHEGSAALTYQARDNLFLTGRYRHYWNTADVCADSYSLETRWELSKRYSILAGYQLQDYRDGPINHGFRIGISLRF